MSLLNGQHNGDHLTLNVVVLVFVKHSLSLIFIKSLFNLTFLEVKLSGFDLVKHSLLFKKLLTKGLPAILVRLLFFMYTVQTTNVRWGNELSDYFRISNGVKQGGVLSAILYCFYVNDLF